MGMIKEAAGIVGDVWGGVKSIGKGIGKIFGTSHAESKRRVGAAVQEALAKGQAAGGGVVLSQASNPSAPTVVISSGPSYGIGGSGLTNGTGGGSMPGIQRVGLLSDLGGLAASKALPAIAGAAATAATSPGGLPVPWWKGPGGSLQMPWSDPRVPEYLKQFALDDSYLKAYYRAPRGYVIVRDANGRPFAVNKQIARSFGLVRPKKKPPISVGDWSAFQKARKVEKKLRKIAGPALRKYGSRAPAKTKKGR